MFDDDGLISKFARNVISTVSSNTSVNISCFYHDPQTCQIVDLIEDNESYNINDKSAAVIAEELVTRIYLPTKHNVEMKNILSNVRTKLSTLQGINTLFRFNITVRKNGQSYVLSTIWFVELANSERPSQLSLQSENIDQFEAIHRELSSFFGVLNAITSHRPTIPFNKSVIGSIVRECFENIDCRCMVRPIVHLVDSKENVIEVSDNTYQLTRFY
jgi:hypothetical protein